MAVRELAADEEVFPKARPKGKVRELRPDEEVRLLTEGDPMAQEDFARFQKEAERQKFISERGPVDRFGRTANVGLSHNPLSLSVDAVNWAMGLTGLPVSDEPLLGSRQIRRAFSALGISPPPGKDDPDTIAGSMGRVTGESVSMLAPVTWLAGRAAVGVETGIRAAPTTVRGAVVQDIGKAAIETPGKFLAAETVAAAGAGTGGYIAREKFPETPAASFIGEVLGGVTPAGVVTAAKIVPTVIGARLARAIIKPFTPTGARTRAAQRVQGAARQPGAAMGEDVLPEAGLTPAQRTGDEGLLSLERSVIESSEQLIGKSDEQIAQATAAIRSAVDDFGGHVPIEKTEVALEESRKYIQSLMDTRMRIAALRADERIAALGPKSTREDANLIAREEIVAARKAVNDQTNELWAAIPETYVNKAGEEVPLLLKTENSTSAFADVVANTPRAQQDDIPDIARKFLDPESNQKFSPEESVKELQGLRSKLLEEGRKARAAGDNNTARIANDLADAVLADLGAQVDNITGEAGEALRAALDSTAYMKEIFDRGPVGKVLAVDVRGAPKTPEALTLETTIGKGGPRAKVETEALIAAADTPALKGAVEDFLLDEFNRRALSGNKLDRKKAEAFLLRNKETLDKFPELRTRIQSAVDAESVAALRAEKAEGLAQRLNDPKVSRAAVFLKEPVEGAMERIAKSPKPDRVMREIIKQARRDPTGDALKGLKTGLGDLLLSRASTRTVTAAGDLLVSGKVMRRMLEEGPVSKMFKTLLSPEEQKRMLDIVDVAEKVEKAVLAKGRPEGIIADNPSLLFSTLARIAGAQLGRKTAQMTGGGTVQTPGIMSNLFKKALTAGTQDPARRLIIDAMDDEKLYTALLAAGEKIETPAVRRQLNAWLISIGAEELRDNE
jgi:hypothetical protein